MPQLQLPIFPEGMTMINANLGVMTQDGTVTYIYGNLPVFTHAVDDQKTFRMITSQLYVNGSAKQADICRAFGVSKISLKRSVKLYREKGIAGFFEQPNRRGPAVLTPVVLKKVQAMLDEEKSIPEISKQMELKADTLRKAVSAGKLHQSEKKDPHPNNSTSKSARSRNDASAPIGMGATNTLGRLEASLFQGDPAALEFSPCLDVPNGGVLLSLPALLSMGLLRHTHKYFELPRGYYDLTTIFLLLAFMAMARLKTIESLRYCSPGEWGKLLGLDRIPEAKTLRDKVKHLCRDDQAQQWAGELSRDWMGMFPETAGVLYIDGHVRVYNGSQAELPRHHVARQKLCLRATTDYWVNAMDGQPFFMVNKAVDPGLLAVLEDEIVPRLEQEVPCQLELFELDKNPLVARFSLIFDREGYSPGFFLRMWKKRISCQTYHKYPGEKWPEAEFQKYDVELISGHLVNMHLAERGTFLGGKIWVREIRRLTKSGHQTAIISTDYQRDLTRTAAVMFARWSQENFFKYMRENYNIDRLADYSTSEIPDTTRVVCPLYREADRDVKRQAAQLGRKRCQCNELVLCDDIEPDKVIAYEEKKQSLLEDVREMEAVLEELKQCRRSTPRHVQISDLPPEDRFKQLAMKSKYFVDTIKMIAYRAETVMANIVRRSMRHQEEARSLLRSLYATEADILPDYERSLLTVRLHQPANNCSATTINKLCLELNETKVKFPGTQLWLVCEVVS